MESLTLADLDPRLADALRDRLTRAYQSLYGTSPTSDDPAWLRAGDIVRQIGRFPLPARYRAMAVVPALITQAPILVGVAGWWAQWPTPGLIGAIAATAAGSWAGYVRFAKAADNMTRGIQEHVFCADMVEALIPTLAPTPGEEAYLKAFVALMEAQDVLGADLARDLAAALRTTLDADRRRSPGAVDALYAAEATLRGLQSPPPTDTAPDDLRRHTQAVEAAVAELRSIGRS